MYAVTRSGSAAGFAVEMRGIPASTVPLIAAKALTFTAQKAQQSILQALPSVFSGGATRYTLNSTRIEPAVPQNLSARVAVKDRTAAGGNVPENFLFPGVFGGPRREKRFERALRYAGLLRSGERAIPGDATNLDSFGNLGVAQVRSILRQLDGQVRSATGAKRRRLAKRKNDLFVGTPDGGGRLPGVYRREGNKRGQRKLRPLLVFVRNAPTYARRLDFEGLAAKVAKAEFEPTFQRLLRASTRAR